MHIYLRIPIYPVKKHILFRTITGNNGLQNALPVADTMNISIAKKSWLLIAIPVETGLNGLYRLYAIKILPICQEPPGKSGLGGFAERSSESGLLQLSLTGFCSFADSYIARMTSTALRASAPSIQKSAPLSTASINAAKLRV